MPHRLVPALLAVLLAPLVGASCGGKVAFTDPDASPPGSTPAPVPPPPSPTPDAGDSGSSGDCAARGGVCLPTGTSAPPNRRPAGAGEGSCGGTDVCWVLVEPPAGGCTIDAECNPSPAISALYGSCFHGICVCKSGYHVQPNGKCDRTSPPLCPSQGGTCYQEPATCPADHLEGSIDSNRTCGDFVAAVCCTPEASCKGPTKDVGGTRVPVEFVCCAPNDALTPPVCVSGWRTCADGNSPVAAPGGCG